MADLPTETITFLFTDIEGSTALARHQAILILIESGTEGI